MAGHELQVTSHVLRGWRKEETWDILRGKEVAKTSGEVAE
jgi:hypothetical protein